MPAPSEIERKEQEERDKRDRKKVLTEEEVMDRFTDLLRSVDWPAKQSS